MRPRRTLLAAALGIAALVYFWPADRAPDVAGRAGPGAGSSRASSTTSAASAVQRAAQQAPVESRTPPRNDGPSTKSAALAEPSVQVNVRSPPRVHSGEPFQVTIDVQATRSIQQVAFSISFSPTVLQLKEWSPGVFVARGDEAANFRAEESSDGVLSIRVNLEGRAFVGPGNVAVLNLRAINPGESRFTVDSISYVESGHQESATSPAGYEGTITVD